MVCSHMSVVRTLLFLALLCAAGPPAGAANVAVIISADVDAYRDALQGFKQTLRHQVVAEYDMEGDFDHGQEILAEIQSEVQPDLILAVGLWALQVAINQPIDVPVVFTMVLNPPAVLGIGAANVTGGSINVPVEKSLRLFKQLGSQIRRVGVVFNPAKTGYLVKQAEAIAREEGLQLVTRAILSPKEAIQAMNSVQEEGVDAFWILPDETILDAKVVRYALLLSYRNNIPLFGLSERQAQMGALISLSFGSSEDIGRQTGELANGILRGKPVREIPYTTARSVKLTVNLKAARKLGMEIPSSIVKMADTVIQ